MSNQPQLTPENLENQRDYLAIRAHSCLMYAALKARRTSDTRTDCVFLRQLVVEYADSRMEPVMSGMSMLVRAGKPHDECIAYFDSQFTDASDVLNRYENATQT